MKSEYKTKGQLINELEAYHDEISQLAYEKAEHKRLEEALEKSVEEGGFKIDRNEFKNKKELIEVK